jgi:hypothetical protein
MCVERMSQCPVTAIKFITSSDMNLYNFDASKTLQPLYYSAAYNSSVNLIWSMQENSMPITTFQMAKKPCMDPQM